jgi:hypothetical protein
MELLRYAETPNRVEVPWVEADYILDGISPLVVALCYEHHLNMHEMLSVFAEHRGDDPEDALGPPDCRA